MIVTHHHHRPPPLPTPWPQALEEDVLTPDPGDEELVEEAAQAWTAATGLPWTLPAPGTSEAAALLAANPDWQQQALDYAAKVRQAPPALDPEIWPNPAEAAAAAGAPEEEVSAAAAAWKAQMEAQAAEQEELVQQVVAALSTGGEGRHTRPCVQTTTPCSCVTQGQSVQRVAQGEGSMRAQASRWGDNLCVGAAFLPRPWPATPYACQATPPPSPPCQLLCLTPLPPLHPAPCRRAAGAAVGGRG